MGSSNAKATDNETGDETGHPVKDSPECSANKITTKTMFVASSRIATGPDGNTRLPEEGSPDPNDPEPTRPKIRTPMTGLGESIGANGTNSRLTNSDTSDRLQQETPPTNEFIRFIRSIREPSTVGINTRRGATKEAAPAAKRPVGSQSKSPTAMGKELETALAADDTATGFTAVGTATDNGEPDETSGASSPESRTDITDNKVEAVEAASAADDTVTDTTATKKPTSDNKPDTATDTMSSGPTVPDSAESKAETAESNPTASDTVVDKGPRPAKTEDSPKKTPVRSNKHKNGRAPKLRPSKENLGNQFKKVEITIDDAPANTATPLNKGVSCADETENPFTLWDIRSVDTTPVGNGEGDKPTATAPDTTQELSFKRTLLKGLDDPFAAAVPPRHQPQPKTAVAASRKKIFSEAVRVDKAYANLNKGGKSWNVLGSDYKTNRPMSVTQPPPAVHPMAYRTVKPQNFGSLPIDRSACLPQPNIRETCRQLRGMEESHRTTHKALSSIKPSLEEDSKPEEKQQTSFKLVKQETPDEKPRAGKGPNKNRAATDLADDAADNSDEDGGTTAKEAIKASMVYSELRRRLSDVGPTEAIEIQALLKRTSHAIKLAKAVTKTQNSNSATTKEKLCDFQDSVELEDLLKEAQEIQQKMKILHKQVQAEFEKVIGGNEKIVSKAAQELRATLHGLQKREHDIRAEMTAAETKAQNEHLPEGVVKNIRCQIKELRTAIDKKTEQISKNASKLLQMEKAATQKLKEVLSSTTKATHQIEETSEAIRRLIEQFPDEKEFFDQLDETLDEKLEQHRQRLDQDDKGGDALLTPTSESDIQPEENSDRFTPDKESTEPTVRSTSPFTRWKEDEGMPTTAGALGLKHLRTIHRKLYGSIRTLDQVLRHAELEDPSKADNQSPEKGRQKKLTTLCDLLCEGQTDTSATTSELMEFFSRLPKQKWRRAWMHKEAFRSVDFFSLLHLEMKGSERNDIRLSVQIAQTYGAKRTHEREMEMLTDLKKELHSVHEDICASMVLPRQDPLEDDNGSTEMQLQEKTTGSKQIDAAKHTGWRANMQNLLQSMQSLFASTSVPTETTAQRMLKGNSTAQALLQALETRGIHAEVINKKRKTPRSFNDRIRSESNSSELIARLRLHLREARVRERGSIGGGTKRRCPHDKLPTEKAKNAIFEAFWDKKGISTRRSSIKRRRDRRFFRQPHSKDDGELERPSLGDRIYKLFEKTKDYFCKQKDDKHGGKKKKKAKKKSSMLVEMPMRGKVSNPPGHWIDRPPKKCSEQREKAKALRKEKKRQLKQEKKEGAKPDSTTIGSAIRSTINAVHEVVARWTTPLKKRLVATEPAQSHIRVANFWQSLKDSSIIIDARTSLQGASTSVKHFFSKQKGDADRNQSTDTSDGKATLDDQLPPVEKKDSGLESNEGAKSNNQTDMDTDLRQHDKSEPNFIPQRGKPTNTNIMQTSPTSRPTQPSWPGGVQGRRQAKSVAAARKKAKETVAPEQDELPRKTMPMSPAMREANELYLISTKFGLQRLAKAWSSTELSATQHRSAAQHRGTTQILQTWADRFVRFLDANAEAKPAFRTKTAEDVLVDEHGECSEILFLQLVTGADMEQAMTAYTENATLEGALRDITFPVTSDEVSDTNIARQFLSETFGITDEELDELYLQHHTARKVLEEWTRRVERTSSLVHQDAPLPGMAISARVWGDRATHALHWLALHSDFDRVAPSLRRSAARALAHIGETAMAKVMFQQANGDWMIPRRSSLDRIAGDTVTTTRWKNQPGENICWLLAAIRIMQAATQGLPELSSSHLQTLLGLNPRCTGQSIHDAWKHEAATRVAKDLLTREIFDQMFKKKQGYDMAEAFEVLFGPVINELIKGHNGNPAVGARVKRSYKCCQCGAIFIDHDDEEGWQTVVKISPLACFKDQVAYVPQLAEGRHEAAGGTCHFHERIETIFLEETGRIVPFHILRQPDEDHGIELQMTRLQAHLTYEPDDPRALETVGVGIIHGAEMNDANKIKHYTAVTTADRHSWTHHDDDKDYASQAPFSTTPLSNPNAIEAQAYVQLFSTLAVAVRQSMRNRDATPTTIHSLTNPPRPTGHIHRSPQKPAEKRPSAASPEQTARKRLQPRSLKTPLEESLEKSLATTIASIAAVPGEGISEAEMARHLINILSPEDTAEISVNSDLLDMVIHHHFHIDMEAVSINDKPVGGEQANDAGWLRDFTFLWDRINKMAQDDQVKDRVNINHLVLDVGVDEHIDDEQLLHHLRSTPNWSSGPPSSQTPTSTPSLSTPTTQPYTPSVYHPPNPSWTDSPPKKKTKADLHSAKPDTEMKDTTTAKRVSQREQPPNGSAPDQPDTEMAEGDMTPPLQESPKRKTAGQHTDGAPGDQGKETQSQLELQRAEARAATKQKEEARTQAERAGMEAGYRAHATAKSSCPTEFASHQQEWCKGVTLGQQVLALDQLGLPLVFTPASTINQENRLTRFGEMITDHPSTRTDVATGKFIIKADSIQTAKKWLDAQIHGRRIRPLGFPGGQSTQLREERSGTDTIYSTRELLLTVDLKNEGEAFVTGLRAYHNMCEDTSWDGLAPQPRVKDDPKIEGFYCIAGGTKYPNPYRLYCPAGRARAEAITRNFSDESKFGPILLHDTKGAERSGIWIITFSHSTTCAVANTARDIGIPGIETRFPNLKTACNTVELTNTEKSSANRSFEQPADDTMFVVKNVQRFEVQALKDHLVETLEGSAADQGVSRSNLRDMIKIITVFDLTAMAAEIRPSTAGMATEFRNVIDALPFSDLKLRLFTITPSCKCEQCLAGRCRICLRLRSESSHGGPRCKEKRICRRCTQDGRQGQAAIHSEYGCRLYRNAYTASDELDGCRLCGCVSHQVDQCRRRKAGMPNDVQASLPESVAQLSTPLDDRRVFRPPASRNRPSRQPAPPSATSKGHQEPSFQAEPKGRPSSPHARATTGRGKQARARHRPTTNTPPTPPTETNTRPPPPTTTTAPPHPSATIPPPPPPRPNPRPSSRQMPSYEDSLIKQQVNDLQEQMQADRRAADQKFHELLNLLKKLEPARPDPDQ